MDNPIIKGEKVYYARALIDVDVFELCELRVRTIGDTWFTAYEDKSKHVYLFSNKDFGATVFRNRKAAIDKLNQSKKKRKSISSETYYEEF